MVVRHLHVEIKSSRSLDVEGGDSMASRLTSFGGFFCLFKLGS